MGKSDSTSSKRESKKTVRWVITIFVITLFVSGAISLLSEELLSRSGMAAAFIILFVIVLVGILFDVVGVAVTSADERPFHSMAARKVPGAQEAIGLLRNAERVGSICNDVVGDICGVISGSASAVIAVKALTDLGYLNDRVDGIFGKKTAKAVQDFQTAAGLTATGAADAETQIELYLRQLESAQ